MKHIKFALPFILLLLTTIVTVVTNLVVLLFWGGDVVQRQREHLRHLLTLTVQSSSASLPPPLQSLLTTTPGACLFYNGSYHAGKDADALCRQSMLAADPREMAAPSSFSDPLASRYLRVAVSLPSSNGERLAAAVAVPLASVLRPLWAKEKVIAIYLLFNALVLGALASFRLLKRYLLPLDRMVQSAESYSGEGFQAPLFDRPSDELSRLAASIQAMVRRIEADKEALGATVRELAEKNLLLSNNQQEMIRAEKLAVVGRLAAGLAHEIGNPLGVVQGYVQLMSMGDCREDERADYGAKAMAELARVDRLIRQLLDHSRVPSGMAQPCDAHHVLHEVAETLHMQPLCGNIAFDVRMEAAQSVVCVERDALRQVLVNCLLNAVDAVRSLHGTNGGQIILTTVNQEDRPDDATGEWLEISITDNGIGVAPECRETVFDPFYTTKEPGKGTGLGLSVSLALVQSMGGSMEFISTAGQGGTTMRIVLPVVAFSQ